jgi:lipoprotein-anchoring transpeptidase ErfK/SrfK
MTIALAPFSEMKGRILVAALAVAACAALLGQALAQPAPTVPPKKQQKKASELIRKQDPPKVIPRVLEKATPDNVSVHISLGKQRAYFKVGEEIAVDSPISSGKRAGMTPKGTFKIVEKDKDHRSSLYGDFVSSKTGKVVRAGVSTRIDSAPSGTIYRGAPMRWFMRFGDGTGFRPEGMHTGVLPGYPASHGCVRLPDDIAKLIFENVKIGTVVTIGD